MNLADLTLRAGPWLRDGEPMEAYGGCERFEPEAVAELEEGLFRLAQYLYGSKLFHRLYRLNVQELNGLHPTFVWMLETAPDEPPMIYQYEPTACGFRRLDPASVDLTRYVGCVRSWASDLLGLTRGEFEPRAIVRGYREKWNPPCEDVRFFWMLVGFFHPLRQPDRCLRRYREVVREHLDAPWLVHGRALT